jgi:hypothetical protein
MDAKPHLVKKPRSLGGYLEALSRPVFQAGMTVDNAQAMIELDAEFKGFRRYLRSHGGFEPTVADLKRQFRFIGDSGAYYFLYVVGEHVPPHEKWFGAQQGASRRPKRAGRRPASTSPKPRPRAARVARTRRSMSRA